MDDASDSDLLAQFARHGSEAAFGRLVDRYLPLVHSVARRHTSNLEQAQDISQAVFVILARKAGTLSSRVVLSGWLYHTARLTAANWQRAEMRRRRREQEAVMQSMLNENAPDEVWRELAPQLDAAMARLSSGDRDALVLRYFQNQSLAAVGAALGVEERAAQKRVRRALEKVRQFFSQRGVALSAGAISAAVSANSVQAAPPALAKTISAIAVAKGAAAGTSTLTLINGTLKIMAWTKIQTAIVVGACTLLAAGTTTVTVKAIADYQGDSWQRTDFKIDILQKTPPRVKVVPTKFPAFSGKWTVETASPQRNRATGISVSATQLISSAFDFPRFDRLILPANLPAGKYDYIASLPAGSMGELQRAVEQRLAVSIRRVTLTTNVLLLKIKQPGAPGLHPSQPGTGHTDISVGEFSMHGATVDYLAAQLEDHCFHLPVLDQTKLTGLYDYDLSWDPSDLGTLKQALQEQLGLELVPATLPVEMLEVEKK